MLMFVGLQINRNRFPILFSVVFTMYGDYEKVQVGCIQEIAQSERNSHSKNLGVGKTKLKFRYLYQENIS